MVLDLVAFVGKGFDRKYGTAAALDIARGFDWNSI